MTNPREITWTSRVWYARNGAGRQTREPSSLAQMARAFQQGVLAPDVEVAVGGEWAWENVRQALARYAALAPPNAHDSRDAMRATEPFPELELTLTGQRDVLPDRSDDATVPAPRPPVTLPAAPPAPTVVEEHVRRMAPTMPPTSPRSVAPPAIAPGDPVFAVAIPARLPNLVFLSSGALAALVLLLGAGAGIQACNERLVYAFDARTTLIAVLVGLGWLAGAAILGAAIAVLGRAAAGVLQIVRDVEERAKRG